MPWRPLPLLLAASAHSAVPPELTDLDLNNFDTFMAEHDNVLVHFWAPCAKALPHDFGSAPCRAHVCLMLAGSKKCEAFKPQLEKVAAVSEFADSMKHARSDISDKRGYTSYLEKFGVLKLPTLVLFRNGHPEMYSYDAPLDYDGVVKWLQAQTSTPALPRGADDISETHFFEQQLQAHQQALRRREQQREQQVATVRHRLRRCPRRRRVHAQRGRTRNAGEAARPWQVSDEEKQRRREFLHPGKRATPEADDEPPARDGVAPPPARAPQPSSLPPSLSPSLPPALPPLLPRLTGSPGPPSSSMPRSRRSLASAPAPLARLAAAGHPPRCRSRFSRGDACGGGAAVGRCGNAAAASGRGDGAGQGWRDGGGQRHGVRCIRAERAAGVRARTP